MDAALLSLWHHGASVQGLAMEAITGANRRESQGIGIRTRHFPVLRHQPADTPRGRVHTLRRVEEMGRRVVRQVAGHGGDRKSHRLTAHHADSGIDFPGANTRVQHFLQAYGHEHGLTARPLHHGRVCRDGHLRRSGLRVALHPAAQILRPSHGERDLARHLARHRLTSGPATSCTTTSLSSVSRAHPNWE